MNYLVRWSVLYGNIDSEMAEIPVKNCCDLGMIENENGKNTIIK